MRLLCGSLDVPWNIKKREVDRRDRSMKENEKHIKDAAHSKKLGTAISLCGEKLLMDFYFLDVDHAVDNAIRRGRLIPCSACINTALESFGSED